MADRRGDAAAAPRVLAAERLTRLLESYGAASERWPPEERDAVRRHVARSATARRCWDEASYLDHLLDAIEDDVPSAALVGRVVAASPSRRPRRLAWRAVLATALVAAAVAAVVWLRAPVPAGAPVRPPGTAPAVGGWETPTDALLAPSGVEATVPAIGCADSVLGCPQVPSDAGATGRRPRARTVA